MFFSEHIDRSIYSPFLHIYRYVEKENTIIHIRAPKFGTNQVLMGYCLFLFILSMLVLNYSHLLRQKTTNFGIACTEQTLWSHNKLSSICLHIRGARSEWLWDFCEKKVVFSHIFQQSN